MAKKSKKPTLELPKNPLTSSSKQSSKEASPVSPVTPKTPADEAIEFFQSDGHLDKPIQVYELRLDADGGPRKETSVNQRVLSLIDNSELIICASITVYSPPTCI